MQKTNLILNRNASQDQDILWNKYFALTGWLRGRKGIRPVKKMGGMVQVGTG